MNIWAFLFGFIAGVFPLTLILRFFPGKFLFTFNPYIKGTAFGFLMWLFMNVFAFFEAKYSFFGFMDTEAGFGTIVLLTSSLQGFITAGLAAAFISTRILKKKPSD